jgi:hypothetical protein
VKHEEPVFDADKNAKTKLELCDIQVYTMAIRQLSQRFAGPMLGKDNLESKHTE